jgi:hypothetical protein
VALSPSTLYTECLGMIEVREDANLNDPRWAKTKNRIATDITAVLQQIYAAMPAVLLDRPDSQPLRAPSTVSGFGVTQYSKTISGSVPSWAIGCAVRLSGDDNWNRFVTSTTLLAPYMGLTGTVNATIYCDCIAPSLTVSSIEAPVVIQGFGELIGVPTRANLGGRDDWRETMDRIIGRPERFVVEAVSDDAAGVIKPRILVDPLPDQAYRLDFMVKLAAPRVEVADLTSTTPILLPLGYGESIILPMVRAAFSSFESFTGDKAAIRDAGKQAFATLGSTARFQGPIRQSVRTSQNW